MQAFIVLVVATVALGAPASDEELQRIKKSYGGGFGAPPCAGAAPIAPVALYLSPESAPSIRDYRAVGHSEEHESELARSYYGGAAGGAGGAGGAIAGEGGAPAVGLFPNAKLGGCAIPLLLSCAPSVHSGHLAHAAPAYGPAAPVASAYGPAGPAASAYGPAGPAASAYGPAGPAIPAIPAISAVSAYRAGADHKMRETAQQQWTEAARNTESLVPPADHLGVGTFPRNPAPVQAQAQVQTF